MEKNELTVKQLDKAISTLEYWGDKVFQREPQMLNEVLPLALSILKSKKYDTEQESKSVKFYAPIWVRVLLERLSSGDEPLSDIEYSIFKSQAETLAISDYKSAMPGMDGYEVQYMTPQEISETVCALKHYFRLI